MPSSLIFAALAAAWLVVLVPMVAKRRHEVARTAESALASRVLRRPDPPQVACKHGQEVRMERTAEREPTVGERRYKSGRGGYDPELAAQLARAKYAFRQRMVLGLVVGAVITGALAYTVSSVLRWLHAALDMAMAAYLGYLRRQVRIEDEVRQRRAARLAGSHSGVSAAQVRQESPAECTHDAEEPVRGPLAQRAAASSTPHPTAVALDFDDEDPMFHELESAFQPPYRQAVGE